MDLNRRRYLAAVTAAVAASGCLDDADNEADDRGVDDTDTDDADGAGDDMDDDGEDGADDDEPDENADGEESVGEWADGTIEFAIPPFQDAEELEDQYQGTLEWLADGWEDVEAVESVLTTDYSGVIESVVNGHTELANLSPVIYALAADEGIHPLVLNMSHGAEAYHAYVATREGTDIESLEDIEGRTIALGDPLSTSGTLFPRYMLQQAGLDAGDVDTDPGDFEIEFAGGHGPALTALEEGHVDAAAYGDFQHPESDEIVKVAESDPIPFDPIVAKPETPEPVREALVDRLVETPEEVLEDHRVDEFAPVEDDTYEPVVEVAEAMGLDVAHLEE